ncbi:o-succinylbenzoate--CoA ligase [Vibrio astriarenae]
MKVLPWLPFVSQKPDVVALTAPDGDLTWLTLSKKISDIAAQIERQGVTAGDVVTIVGKNNVDALLVYLANIQLGAITAWIMPEPWSRTQNKLEQVYSPDNTQLKRRFVLSHPEGFRVLDVEVRENLAKHYVLLEIDSKAGSQASSHNVSFDAHNISSLIFTSGSMGNPKAVAHRYEQHAASAKGLLNKFEFHPEDTWLLSLPMYHVSGLAIVHRWLLAGACLKLGHGNLTHDIEGVTHASLVPTQLKRLLEEGIATSLRRVLLGGAHIPVELAIQAQRQGIDTWLGYGMTEMASTVTAKQVDSKVGVGEVLPLRQLRLVDNRVQVAGETLAAGYYRQGTLVAIGDSDGWFDTKDLAHYHNGDLVIDGRADNCFISGGENIHCEEIEAVANRFAGVIQSMTIPIEDDQFGARPMLLIQPSDTFNLDEFNAHLATHLVNFKQPKYIEALPASLLEGGIKLSRYQVKSWVSKHFVKLKVM